jgi:predicted ATPase
MARRRDVRRFGRGPYVLGLRRVAERWGSGFPYDLPAVAAVEHLRLDAPVTLLAGDNGTGKSTLVEAIAAAMGFDAEGGQLQRSGELPAVPRPVLDAVRLTRGFVEASERYVRAALEAGAAEPG